MLWEHELTGEGFYSFFEFSQTFTSELTSQDLFIKMFITGSKQMVSFLFFPSLAKSQHYSDGLIDIFTQYGDHLYR